MNITVLEKVYEGEELYDITTDIQDSLKYVPREADDYGFSKGTFKVVIVYEE